MRITYTNTNGERAEKIIVNLETDNQLYASANHWPREWYRAVLLQPAVEISVNGQSKLYLARAVTDANEFRRVDSQHAHGLGFRLLTGFAPRKILRFDPI